MTRTVIIFLLITGLLAKKYLIEVADKGGDEGVDSGEDEGGDEGGDEEGGEGEIKVEDGEGSKGGSDFSVRKSLRMVMDKGRMRFRRSGGAKKNSGDTLTLTCNVSFRGVIQLENICNFKVPPPFFGVSGHLWKLIFSQIPPRGSRLELLTLF